MRDEGRIWIAILLLVALSPARADAQEYPSRAIRLIVASSAGSGVDIVARVVARRMTDTIGVQLVIDNRAGAAGAIGGQLVAKSAPDGYTLLMTGPSFAINATLVRKLPYDPIRDFAPVGQATTGYYVVVVHPSLPVASVKELIALARARPGQLNFGSGGSGNSTHLAAEYFKVLARIDIVHVPYKGSGPALIDLVAGQIHLMVANVTAAVPHVKTGKLRALATSGETRSLALPDLPTVAEAGVPGYVVTNWFGILAPAGTPQDAIGKLNSALVSAMRDKDMRDLLAGEGAEPAPSSPAAFGKLLASEVVRWGKVSKMAGLQ
jgi:tripartite-type tricarboxylate transporter receptor subunit TctC